MNEGEYTLQHQRGAKGYYGKIRLRVTSQDGSGLGIHFQEQCPLNWRIGVAFGIMYGWERLQRELCQTNGLTVEVLEVTGQPVDTNNLVMAFVSANALWNALGWSPSEPPVFDLQTGCFTFPK